MKPLVFFLFQMLVLNLSAQINFPLKASQDTKYLVDQNDRPVFLNGCASWRLPYALSYADAKKFLIDRKAKKFNAVLVQVTPDAKAFNNHPERMPLGVDAFENNDLSKPNAKYFLHLDSLLTLCEEMNIAVLIAPMYLGCCGDGWLEIIQKYNNSTEICRQYGQWFANKYKNYKNLIWVSGGDHNAVPESIAFAEGIASVDTTHLHTFHAHPGKSSADRFRGSKWHTLSAAYTYFPAMEKDTAWQYTQVYTMLYDEMINNYRMPCILMESAYEDERFTNIQTLRRQAYWSLLGGASGHIFGQRDIWQMNAEVMNSIKRPGSESMKIFKTFTESIPWYKMKPDWAHTFFVSGRGTFNSTIYPGGEDYATGAFMPDSSMAVLYLPETRKVGVNMSRLKKPATAQWFDPSSGKYIAIAGRFNNQGVHFFVPPSTTNTKGFDDWVLVVKITDL